MKSVQEKIIELSQKHNLKEMGLRQIGRLIGVEHPQVIKYHLGRLGLLEETRRNVRIDNSSILSVSTNNLISLPILGLANCGDATAFADSRIEGSLTISPRLLPVQKSNSLFVVKAVGSSMNMASVNGKNIEEGDYVVVDAENKDVKTNDYVLSVIGGLANIKKYVEDKNQRQIALLSESKFFFPPIYLHEEDLTDYLVNGKVIDVIKETNTKDTYYEPI